MRERHGDDDSELKNVSATLSCVSMNTISIEVPPEVAQALRLPESEVPRRVRLELAVALYAQRLLGLGKAAELAGLTRLQLNDVLHERGVPMHYGEQELTEDTAYATHRQ